MLASRLRCADPATPRVQSGVGSASSGRSRAPCRPKPSWGRLTVRSLAEASAAVQTQQPGVEASLLRVGFSVRVRVGWGDTVLLTGSHTSLGEWDVTKAVPLSWSTDADGSDVWSTTCELPEHFVVRFKARPRSQPPLAAHSFLKEARRTETHAYRGAPTPACVSAPESARDTATHALCATHAPQPVPCAPQ
jgi:hypothetical protein